MIKKIKIGTRDSKLAIVQTDWVAAELKKTYPDLEIEIIKIKTLGDKILDVALSKIGDKGLFTKELENELVSGNIDLAVHSMKDLPTKLPDGLEIAVTTKREDLRDVVCISQYALKQGIKEISEAKRVASSSLRRIAQLKNYYPQLEFMEMRGNLQTRFKKLDDEANQIDAIVLAAAGILRLAASNDNEISQIRINQFLDPEEVLPAVGQGALGIEIKANRDDELRNFLRKALNSTVDEQIILGERAYLRRLEGGCQVPVGIYSRLIANDEVSFKGMVASLDGKKLITSSTVGKLSESEQLGLKFAEDLLAKGADEILRAIR